MKKLFLTSFTLFWLNIGISFIGIIKIRQWMISTKLILLTKAPLQILLFSIIVSTCAIMQMLFFSRRKWKAFPSFTLIFSIPFIILEFMYAHLLCFNTEKFFGQQMAKWVDTYNSREVQDLMRTYKCCGYYVGNEFPSAFCPCEYKNGKRPPPCMFELTKVLKLPLQYYSFFYFIVGLLRLTASVLFFLSYNTNDDPNNRFPSRFINRV